MATKYYKEIWYRSTTFTCTRTTLEQTIELAQYQWMYQNGVVHDKKEDELYKNERAKIKILMVL